MSNTDINISVTDLQTLYTNYKNKINEEEKLNKLKKGVREFVNSEFVFSFYKSQVKEIVYANLIKFQDALQKLLTDNDFKLFSNISA